MRAFVQLWDELTLQRYGVTDPSQRRFRYGVQVNSLGLTEAQPENNVQRIVWRCWPSRCPRTRGQGCPAAAWNEALGLPRPGTSSGHFGCSRCWPSSRTCWSTTTSCGIQCRRGQGGRATGGGTGRDRPGPGDGWCCCSGRVGLHESAMVASHSLRRQRIESGVDVVVGVNKFVTQSRTRSQPTLTPHHDGRPRCGGQAAAAIAAWRRDRDSTESGRSGAESARARLVRDARSGANLMPASLEAARAGLTTGEWAQALRDVFG